MLYARQNNTQVCKRKYVYLLKSATPNIDIECNKNKMKLVSYPFYVNFQALKQKLYISFLPALNLQLDNSVYIQDTSVNPIV